MEPVTDKEAAELDQQLNELIDREHAVSLRIESRLEVGLGSDPKLDAKLEAILAERSRVLGRMEVLGTGLNKAAIVDLRPALAEARREES